jgi:hypothetical protein
MAILLTLTKMRRRHQDAAVVGISAGNADFPGCDALPAPAGEYLIMGVL